MLFSINLLNKEIKSRYPEKIGDGSLVDSYRGYSIDIGYFDQDTYEGSLTGKDNIKIKLKYHLK